ncbi:peptidase family m13 domain-containing protein [Ditylenchus destructor]|uniref:Peptidase family m13 domain-containing protein n=1 Tax=Ditylenchus destructor TaxID=166010 RepID=A0AAD4QZ03_9BILA|nr:peptidase family m13 domain-containing protein [Ditylenchus destructor]
MRSSRISVLNLIPFSTYNPGFRHLRAPSSLMMQISVCCIILLQLGTVTTCLPSFQTGEGSGRMEFIKPAMDTVDIGVGPGFVKASDMFKNSVNETVDPCDDFYEFACGKWVANNKIPDDLTSYGHFTELREKVNMELKNLYEDSEVSTATSINTLKQIYKGCMDVDSLNAKNSTELLKKVAEFGYWPIIHGEKGHDGEWDANKFDLTQLMIDIGQSRAIDVFVDVYVSLDQKDVNRRRLHFDQGGLGLGSSARDYYLNETRYAKQMGAYEEYMNNKIRLFARDAGSKRTDEEIAQSVKAILDFEKKFAAILVPEEQRRNYTKMYNVRRFSELPEIFGELDWNTYFKGLMPEDMHFYLDSNPELIINELEFFKRLAKLLQSTDKKIIADYIIWRYTSAWSFQLDERFDDVQQSFLKSFIGKQSKSPRWKDCIAAAGSRLSYASGAMYVRKHFNKEDRGAALEMIEDLRGSFRIMLNENDWMMEETKVYALEKANEMLSLIGFPDFIYNDTQLDEYYANLTLNPEDDYATQVEKTSLWAQKKASAVVNAFYSSVKNAITFPAAILQAPFFDRSFPKAVNYGGIGAVIGHEITHGFDDQGSQFDKLGNLKNWWDRSTLQRFLNRTKCIINQYSQYEVPDTGLKVNGILTQGENIADNGGIKQAFNAYRNYIRKLGHEEKRLPGFETYSNDQIFFISYAQTWCGRTKPETAIRQVLIDPHSPMRFRVNGVVVNQPAFAQAFSCPVGSKMNLKPEERCSVW